MDGYIFTPGRPQPIHHGASMAFFPIYFVVTGYIEGVFPEEAFEVPSSTHKGQLETRKVEGFYDCSKWDPDSVRFDFQKRYHNGVKSIQVRPLYDLGRYL
jgi:hypothetical protein